MARPQCAVCGKAQAVRPGKLCNKCYSEQSKTVKTEKVALGKVRIDGGTQARVGVNESVVADYAEAIGRGAKFPPVVLFFDGSHHWLGDGFHRCLAALKANLLEIEAEVRRGTRRDALLYAVGANATHGLRRTTADKENAVKLLLDDEEWSKSSTNWLATAAGVSYSLAERVRKSREEADKASVPATRVGMDGHERPTSRAGSRAENQRGSEPETPRTEKKADQAATPRDGEGTPLPDSLRDVFGDRALPECIAEVDEALDRVSAKRIIGRLRSRLKSLPFLLAGDLEQRIEEASAALVSARELLVAGTPHAVCECCLGQGCRACRQAGYLPLWKLVENRQQGQLAS